MTWTLHSGTGEIEDHTGTIVATLDTSGGFSFPQDLFDVMLTEANDAYDNNNVERALFIVAHAAFHNVEIQ